MPAVGSVVLATTVPNEGKEHSQLCLVVQRKLKQRRVLEALIGGVRNKTNEEFGKMTGTTKGIYFCASAQEVEQLAGAKDLEFMPVESWRILGKEDDFDLEFLPWMSPEDLDAVSDAAVAIAKRIKV